MRSSAGRAVLAVVLVALLGVGLAAPAVGQASDADSTMYVALQPDGDARWTVSARLALEPDNDTAAFDRLATEFVDGESSILSVEPYRNAASLASDATDREMAIENISRAADGNDTTGVLRLSFSWTNFARVERGGERLVLGDVFATPTGTWLPGLQRGQLLVVEFPAGFAPESVSRPLVNGSIVVEGPTTFQPGRPSAALQRTGANGTPGTTPGMDVIPSATSAGAVLVVLLVLGYLVYRNRLAGDEATGGGGDAGAGAAADNPVDEELLSDEERVLRLLDEEGGRMKQVNIVEETDWSNAKVSQLLSGMADEGRIEKLRIGRENLISLPEAAVSDEE